MKMNQKWIAKLIALVGGIVFGIQLWAHAHFQYSQLDEGAYAVKGLLFATGKYIPYQSYGPWTNHMPLSFLIPGYIQVLFGPGLQTIRYFSVVLALFALVGIWITARRIGGEWWGAIAVWIFAASPAMAKFYSQSVSQVLIFFMLAWVLALTLGENLPRWKVVFGAMFAGAIFLTRINMVPVFVFTLGYIFWQYGWRTGLVSSLAGSVVIAIGLVWYWPDIFGYMLSRYPLAGAPLLTYMYILLAGLSIFILWVYREKYIHHPLIKGIFGVSVYIALIALTFWASETDAGGQNQILNVVGYHALILIFAYLVYYLWKRGKNSIEEYIFSPPDMRWRIYFILVLSEGIAALVGLFLLPSDPKNALIFGYSLPRIALILAMLVYAAFAFWLTLRSWKHSTFSARIHEWVVSWRNQNRKYLWGVVLLSGVVVLSCFLIIQAVIVTDEAIKAPLVRLVPFFALLFFLSVQTLLFISYKTRSYSSVQKFLFDIFSTLLGIYIIVHINQEVFSSPKMRSFYAGIRSHFIPIMALVLILAFWRGRKSWEKLSEYRMAVVITGLFITLILVHMYATFGEQYCVHCLQPYYAFFSQLGIILLILLISHLDKRVSQLSQFILVMVVLFIFIGLGYVVDKYTGLPVLAYTFLGIAVVAGIRFVFTERGKFLEYSTGAFLGIAVIGFGLMFSPSVLLGGGYQDLDCDVDIIAYYESFGEELYHLIPEGSQVFWWGSSPVPLLYLPERNIYPGQLNSTAYVESRDTEDVLQRSHWNAQLGQQWVYEADFLIIKDSIKIRWFRKIIDGHEFQAVLHIPISGSCQRELDYTVYQPVP